MQNYQKKTVHILYSNIKDIWNEFAFLFPIVKNKAKLKRDFHLNIKLYSDHNDISLFDCDTLIVSCYYFGRKMKSWINDPEEIFSFLKNAQEKKLNVIWADLSDSTGTTQFQILPYVDLYIKSQLLIDKTRYGDSHYSMRIYGDFYHKRFSIEDDIPMEDHLIHPCVEAEFEKIKLGWNSGFATYSCLGLYYNLINYRYFDFSLPLFYPANWISPYMEKNIPVSCRVGVGYKRNTMRYQRERVKELLSHRRVDTSNLSRLKYFSELRQSLICVSPFGWGEICLRDFEIIVSGGLIMKADCSHMETFPGLFVKDKSYLDYRWDLGDFDEKLDYALSHPAEMKDRANYAQRIYKNLLMTEQGTVDFCRHFCNLIGSPHN